MKRMFLFLSLLAVSVAPLIFAGEGASPEEAAKLFNQALEDRDFKRIGTMVTPDSLPIVETWRKVAAETKETMRVSRNGDLAIVEMVPPAVPDSFFQLYLRKVDGVWKVDLRGWHKRAEYAQVDPRFTCSSNLKQIALGLLMYANDKNNAFPADDGAAGLDELRSNEYLIDPAVYVCPLDKERNAAEKGAALTEKNNSYVYFGGFSAKSIPAPSRMPLALEKPGLSHNGETNVLFADGHVEWVKGEFKSVAELIEALIARGGLDKQAEALRQKAAAADLRLKEETK